MWLPTPPSRYWRDYRAGRSKQIGRAARVSRKKLLADTRDRDVRAEKGGIENGWKNKQQSDQQHRQLEFFGKGKPRELDERECVREEKYRVQAYRVQAYRGPCTSDPHHWVHWSSGSGPRKRCWSCASRTGAGARDSKSGRAASSGNRILERRHHWNERRADQVRDPRLPKGRGAQPDR